MSIRWPFQLGAHPINWVGEDVKEHGADTPYERILDEMNKLGVTGTEMGCKYPTDVATLKRELATRGIQLVSRWKSVLFTDPAYREAELEAYRKHVLFLKEMGSKLVSTCEVGGSLHFDPRRTTNEKEVVRLDDDGWKHLSEGLNAAGAFAAEHGLKLTYHHHGGTVVERPEEIDRLMEMTDKNVVQLLFDTGHAYYGGADPAAVLRKHYDRIAYVHLKDVRIRVLEESRSSGVDFVTAIRMGVFTLPGTGDLDFAPIVNELITRGYDGWVMLEGEQDPVKAPAYEYGKRAIDYLDKLIATRGGQPQ